MTSAAITDYRRLVAATLVLTELSAGPDGDPIAEILAGDAVVLARMRAARAVVAADGLPAGPVPGGRDLLAQAAGWQHYARGPVSPLHRDCAADIARGLLRLWAREHPPRQSGREVQPGRLALRRARLDLAGQARSRCAALRAELREGCGVGAGGEGDFRSEVMRRVVQVCQEIEESVGWTLGEPAGTGAVTFDLPPPPRPGGPEQRLTILLAAGFGTGAALAVARVLGEAVPAWSHAALAIGAAAGLALGGWVARIRRAIGRRAALERWVGDVTAALRATLDGYIATRILAAEVTIERRR